MGSFEKLQQSIEAITAVFTTGVSIVLVSMLAGLIRQLHKHTEHGHPLSFKFILIGMVVSGFVGWNVSLLLPDSYSNGVRTCIAGMCGFFAPAILSAFERAMPAMLEKALKAVLSKVGINIEDFKNGK